MPNTPLKPEDMNKFAGQMVTADSPMFDLLPKGCTIVVGGAYCKPSSNEEVPCHICNCPVFLDYRDRPALEGESVLCILCPDCYFKMEPKEAH
jgi:hypothetical protein